MNLRRTFSALALAVAALSPAPVFAEQERESVRFSEEFDFDGLSLRLQGRLALRRVRILGFPIKAYVAALYSGKFQPEESASATSREVRVLVLHFLRDVSLSRLRAEWEDGLRATCHPPCLRERHMKEFDLRLRDLRKGERLVFVFTPEAVELRIANEIRGRVGDPEFTSQVLEIFLGPNTAFADVRRDLLGL